jgi:hypothetical protein
MAERLGSRYYTPNVFRCFQAWVFQDEIRVVCEILGAPWFSDRMNSAAAPHPVCRATTSGGDGKGASSNDPARSRLRNLQRTWAPSSWRPQHYPALFVFPWSFWV